MSILPEWRRINSWFAVVSADTAPLVPLEPAAQDDPDGHPLDLRYRSTIHARMYMHIYTPWLIGRLRLRFVS